MNKLFFKNLLLIWIPISIITTFFIISEFYIVIYITGIFDVKFETDGTKIFFGSFAMFLIGLVYITLIYLIFLYRKKFISRQ